MKLAIKSQKKTVFVVLISTAKKKFNDTLFWVYFSLF